MPGPAAVPAAVPVDDAAVAAIRRRWDLGPPAGATWARLPSAGLINAVYALGPDHVLRVPHDHPAHVDQARREAAAIPLARAAGVRTAPLVAFDDACDLLPVPYLVVARLAGVDAESAGHDDPRLWTAVGRDLGRLHPVAADGLAPHPEFAFPDPRELVEARVADGWIARREARWLATWLDRLAGLGGAAVVEPRLVHGDVQASNVLVARGDGDPLGGGVDPGDGDRSDADGAYEALIDWGCARPDDPVADLVALPMALVPHVLAGHREVAPLPDDDHAEARVLWRRLQLLLAVLPRGAAPGTTWAERPVAWLTDLLRFFLAPPSDPWRAAAPPTDPLL